MADVEKLIRVLHRLVDAGNTVVIIEHNLDIIAEADWIIEAVAENLEIKRALLARVAQVRKPGAIVTTNTSGPSSPNLGLVNRT